MKFGKTNITLPKLKDIKELFTPTASQNLHPIELLMSGFAGYFALSDDSPFSDQGPADDVKNAAFGVALYSSLKMLYNGLTLFKQKMNQASANQHRGSNAEEDFSAVSAIRQKNN